jgi:hypothetical protein
VDVSFTIIIPTPVFVYQLIEDVSSVLGVATSPATRRKCPLPTQENRVMLTSAPVDPAGMIPLSGIVLSDTVDVSVKVPPERLLLYALRGTLKKFSPVPDILLHLELVPEPEVLQYQRF